MGDKIADLDLILKMWAWTAYKTAKGGSPFEYEEVDMRIVWDKVSSEIKESQFSNANVVDVPDPKVLKISVFENGLDQEQSHSFEMNEESTSTVTTTLTKGITGGPSDLIKIAVPKEVTESASDFGGVTVIKDEKETTGKPHTWNVNTTLAIPARKTTTVQLMIQEKCFECDFTTQARLYGTVLINIVHQQTGDLLMVVQNDLATILRDIIEADEGSDQFLDVDFEGKKAIWAVAGHMKYVYGVEGIVKFWSKNLLRGKGERREDDDSPISK